MVERKKHSIRHSFRIQQIKIAAPFILQHWMSLRVKIPLWGLWKSGSFKKQPTFFYQLFILTTLPIHSLMFGEVNMGYTKSSSSGSKQLSKQELDKWQVKYTSYSLLIEKKKYLLGKPGGID